MSPAPPAPAVVAGHICLDVIPTFRHGGLPEAGRLSEVGPAVFAPGGAVSNTGLALHRLGVPVRLVGKVGQDRFGDILVGLLPEGLRAGVRLQEGETTSYTVVLSPPEADRAFLHCSGANDHFRSRDVPEEALEGARAFHLGYPPLLAALRDDGGGELARLMARARRRGLYTSLDMAVPDPKARSGQAPWPQILPAVLPQVDLFMPSLGEMQAMLGPLGAEAMGERLLEMGAGTVVLKRGEGGLDLFAPGLQLHQAALRPRRFEGATGSGDAAVAGFLAAHLRDLPADVCLHYAAAAGATATEAPDATSGVPSWEELTRRLEAGWPEAAGGRSA